MTAFDRARRTYCGLHGHDRQLQFEQYRLFLKCVSCGHETPGWELPDKRPRPIYARAREPRLMRPHLAETWRVA
jgi:hypothetical protein